MGNSAWINFPTALSTTGTFLEKSGVECAILIRPFKGFGCVDVMECVRCGAAAIIEGSLMEMSGGGGISFRSNERSLLERFFGGGSRKINAHACLHCSHLELTVEFSEEDRKRYQEFDGPQPNVLDRIT